MMVVFPLMGYSQAVLTGIVMNESTGDPLAGAHIVVASLEKGTLTDHQGRFQIGGIAGGDYEIVVTYIGYTSLHERVSIAADGKLIRDFLLSPGEVVLADIVVSAGTSRPVTALSQVDIRLRPVSTSQDILRMVPGLFIAQHAGGGKAEQIFLRGFDIDHGTDLNLEVDGMPVNMVSHAHGQGYSDLHFLIPELIHYVDFNTGPYYADKGDFATAGYVSFVTKNALEENFARMELARFGTIRTTAGINLGKNDNPAGYVAGEYFRSAGYFESPQDFDRINIASRYSIQLGEGDHLALLGSVFGSGWNASGQIPERAVRSGMITRLGSLDDTEGGHTRRFNATIRHQHEAAGGGSFEQQLFGIRYDFDLFSNFTFYRNDPVNGDQIRQRESRMVYGYKARYKKDATLLGRPLQIETGGSLRHDDVSDIALMHTMKRDFLGDIQRGDIKETSVNVHTEERVELNDSWSVSAGIRLDHFRFGYFDRLTHTGRAAGKTIVSPKIKVDFRIGPKSQLYLRSGTGFHSNDARVAVARNGRDILPKAYGVDLGGDFKIREDILIHAAVWQLDLDQEFVYVGDEGIIEPGGRTRRRGIDLSVRYQLLPGLFLDSDLNLTHPFSRDEPEGSDHIPLAPVISSAGGLTLKDHHGISSSLRYRYLGDRPANEYNTAAAKGYMLTDLVINYSRHRYEVGFSIQNLFNVYWNEAQFDTESRLYDESSPVSEIHFTPGGPRLVKLQLALFW